MDIHTYPIKLKRHAAFRVIERCDMSIAELRHIIKTGRYVRKPKKEGDIGMIERSIGKKRMRIKFKVEQGVVWIITVEGG